MDKIRHASYSGTHWVCDNRLKKDGEKSKCCDCFPHENCGEVENALNDIKLDFIEETLKEFDDKFKCIQKDCDGTGNIPYQVGDDDWEADQCQFHAEYIFPIKKFLKSKLQEAIEQTKLPMGVSQWRKHGQDNGYWEYFEKEAFEKGRKDEQKNSDNYWEQGYEQGKGEQRDKLLNQKANRHDQEVIKYYKDSLVSELEKLPTSFPELESDSYDEGCTDTKDRIINIIKNK